MWSDKHITIPGLCARLKDNVGLENQPGKVKKPGEIVANDEVVKAQIVSNDQLSYDKIKASSERITP